MAQVSTSSKQSSLTANTNSDNCTDYARPVQMHCRLKNVLWHLEIAWLSTVGRATPRTGRLGILPNRSRRISQVDEEHDYDNTGSRCFFLCFFPIPCRLLSLMRDSTLACCASINPESYSMAKKKTACYLQWTHTCIWSFLPWTLLHLHSYYTR